MAPRVFLLCVLITQGFLSVNCDDKASEQTGLYFTQEPKNVFAQKNEPLLIPCSAISARNKKLTWHWLHNGLPIVSDERRQVLSNGSLYFSTIKHKRSGISDQGEYRCIITDGDGFLSSMYVHLRVAGMPVFTEHPDNQTAKGETAAWMSCQAESLPTAEITWERDSGPVPHWDDKYLIFSGPGFLGSVLYILNLEHTDAGNYRCVATNPVSRSKRKSKPATLVIKSTSVFAKPKILTPSHQKDVEEGDLVVLDCVASGFPPPVLFWTYRKTSHYPPLGVFNSTTNGHNIVYLEDVKVNQSGLYICNFVSDSVLQSVVLDLRVSKRPEIVERPQTVSYQAARAVRFYCKAKGNPVPTITWMKDGTHLNIRGRFGQNTKVNSSLGLRTTELIVASSLASDAGIYQCVAQNSVGVTWSATRLILNSTKQAPRAPENVTCETVSSTEIRVNWDVNPEVVVSGLQAFTIHYHDIDGGEEFRDAIPPTNRSYIVRSLMPYTNYTFYLRSYSDAASDFSNQVVCRTEEEVPEAAPEVHLINSSSRSLQISWTPLTKLQARGEIIEYKIQWRLNGTPSIDIHRVPGEVLNYTITNLTPNGRYEIRVLAATNRGWSTLDFPWKLFKVPGLTMAEQLPPVTVKLQALNSSTVKAEWSVEEDVGVNFQGYKLFLKKENFLSYYGPMVFKRNETEFYMTDLEPETRYEVTVVAFLGLDEGKRANSVVKTLAIDQSYEKGDLEHIPLIKPPVSLRAEPVGRGIISLSWIPPESSVSSITDYTVCYNPVQSSLMTNNSSVSCLRSSENKISIVNLEPSSLYEFRVRSNGRGDTHSEYSSSVECYTAEDVPSQVINVRWKVENKSTIYISWGRPKRTNGYIQNYTLYYSQDSSLPLSSWTAKVVSADTYETRLTDVIPNTEYYMIIRASTNAGLGLYGKPKRMIIPVLVGIASKKSSKSNKDRRNEQYMGIIVGLGIGLTCIIICTLCIVCRRRCAKIQAVEEIEPATGRGTIGPSRNAESEARIGTQETGFFPYASTQNSRVDDTLVERNVNKKDRPYGLSNGVQASLLGEKKSPKSSPFRENLHKNENPGSDESHIFSPLLASASDNRDVSADSDILNHSEVPLLSESQKFSDSEDFNKLNSEVAESEKEIKTCIGLNSDSANAKSNILDDSVSRQDIKPVADNVTQSGDENCKNGSEYVNENEVLENPDFRFSDPQVGDNSPVKTKPQTIQNGAVGPLL